MLAALVANRRIHSICCTGCSFSCFLAVVNASYLYIISIAPVLRLAVWGTLQEVRMYWYGCVEACGSVLLRHGMNFSTDWCTMRLISVEKDWKHVLTHKVVTLNTCCDIACLTFQSPHITTGYFQSHRRQPTTGSFWSFQRLKERNKPSDRWKGFTIHELLWCYFQVGWASGLQFVSFWDNKNNQKYEWILFKMTFFDFPR